MAKFNVFEADGVTVRHSLADNLGAIIASISINNASNPTGSQLVPELAGVNGAIPITHTANYEGGTKVTISGTTVSWQPGKYSSGVTDTTWSGIVHILAW